MSASQHDDDDEKMSGKETTAEITMKRHRSDADTPSEKIPEAAAAVLSADYAHIAQLFAQLDQQVGTFTANMDTVIQQVPAFAGLTTLWEEQAKAASTSTSTSTDPTQTVRTDANDADIHTTHDNYTAILGDEAENTNDPLIFI
jgi:hypothetical protein